MGHEIERYASEGPQSALEQKFIQEYLSSKGLSLDDLHRLP
jgi:hypothetical protein